MDFVPTLKDSHPTCHILSFSHYISYLFNPFFFLLLKLLSITIKYFLKQFIYITTLTKISYVIELNTTSNQESKLLLWLFYSKLSNFANLQTPSQTIKWTTSLKQEKKEKKLHTHTQKRPPRVLPHLSINNSEDLSV